jgi:hypothetical protein
LLHLLKDLRSFGCKLLPAAAAAEEEDGNERVPGGDVPAVQSVESRCGAQGSRIASAIHADDGVGEEEMRAEVVGCHGDGGVQELSMDDVRGVGEGREEGEKRYCVGKLAFLQHPEVEREGDDAAGLLASYGAVRGRDRMLRRDGSAAAAAAACEKEGFCT